jgi:hypothetical protein
MKERQRQPCLCRTLGFMPHSDLRELGFLLAFCKGIWNTI